MRPFALILLLAASPMVPSTSAQAQTWPGWPAPPPAGSDPHQVAAEQHRQAIEQLRLQAEQREIEARLQRLEAALTIQRLEAERPPAPPSPPVAAYASPSAPPASSTVPVAMGQTPRGVDEIDAWLKRQPY